MKCSICGSEFDDDLNFCPHCGTSSHVIKCPQCGEEYNNVGVYCPNCGYKLKEDSEEHGSHVERAGMDSDSKDRINVSNSAFNGGSESKSSGSAFNGGSESKSSSSTFNGGSKGSVLGGHINLDAFDRHPKATGITLCCIGLVIILFLAGALSPDSNTSDNSYSDSNLEDYSSNLSSDLSDSYNSSSSYDDDYSDSSSSDETYDYDSIVFDNDGDNRLSLEEYAAMAADFGYGEDDAQILAQIFDKFDTNHDDYWDIDEYNAFLNS